jgi:hypothetical protein
MGIEEREEVLKNEFIIFSKKYYRKLLKSRENYAHLHTGSLQDTKQTLPK